MSGLILRVIFGSIVAWGFVATLSSESAGAAPVVGSSELNSFCSVYKPPDQTPYGFMEAAYFADGSRNSLGNATFNVAAGTTQVNVNYRIETWFCNQRPYYLEYRNFRAIDTTSGNNIFTATNSASRKICPNPRGSMPEGCTTAGPYTRPSGYTHKLMTQSPWVPGRLNIPSNWRDGETRQICLRYDEPRSGSASGWYIGERQRCYQITIRYTDWNLTINSHNRVQSGGSGSFSSYGNYHEGSAARTIKVGDVVQWQHDVKNTGRGRATFDRWPDAKGQTSSSYAPSAGYARNGSVVSDAKLNGGATGKWPADAAGRRYTAVMADVGKTICERYGVGGGSSSSSAHRHSRGSCVRVVANWSLSGTTTANRTTAAPGQTITWTHTLRNNGADPTHRTVQSAVQAQVGAAAPTDRNAATTAANRGVGEMRKFTTTYSVTSADLGKQICHRLKWNPTSGGDTNPAYSYATNRCVSIPYNFDLTPHIGGINSSLSVAPGSKLPTINPSIDNRVPAPGVTTRTPSTIQWQLSRFIMPKGASQPASGVNGTQPCTYFGNGCTPIDGNGDPQRSFAVGVTSLPQQVDEEVGIDLPVGSSICYGLSVQPYADGTINWRHTVVCLTVGKRPTVQVWGGDVRATGLISTATTSGKKSGPEPVAFGSWAEYGVFSRGLNGNANGTNSMSSGSGLATGSIDFAPTSYHKLTFANVNAAGASSYGNFSFATPVSVRGQFTSLATTNTLTAATVGAGSLTSNVYRRAGNLTINGGTIGAGRSVIINVTGTVTITGDITYANGPYTSVAQLPQLVITAANVHVHNSVKNVDAWLLTTGVIDTCSNVGTAGAMPASGSQLKEGVCGDPLVVNGPVATNRLVLKRTGGSNPGPDRDQPAELFKLRPDAYMWLKGRGGAGVQAWTTSTAEMPARY